MKPASYRFMVARGAGFYVLGVLPDWPGGNEAALRHLEAEYKDWTKITIRKIAEHSYQQSACTKQHAVASALAR